MQQAGMLQRIGNCSSQHSFQQNHLFIYWSSQDIATYSIRVFKRGRTMMIKTINTIITTTAVTTTRRTPYMTRWTVLNRNSLSSTLNILHFVRSCAHLKHKYQTMIHESIQSKQSRTWRRSSLYSPSVSRRGMIPGSEYAQAKIALMAESINNNNKNTTKTIIS